MPLPLPSIRRVQGAALPTTPPATVRRTALPGGHLYTSAVIRAFRLHRTLLQPAFIATLLMVLAPLVSRALQAPQGQIPSPQGRALTPSTTHGGMDHAHRRHGDMTEGQSPLPGQRDPTPPADPHAMHGEACEYCVLAMRLLPWLAVLVLLLPLLWRPTLVFPWSPPRLPLLHWPAHAARGPPLVSNVR